MPDLRILQVASPYVAATQWARNPDGTFDERWALASAIDQALRIWRRADASDDLPNPQSRERNGWWGDTDAEEVWDGWPAGSRLWLMVRDKMTGPGARVGSVTTRAKHFIAEAIQPFVDHAIISSFSIDVRQETEKRLRLLLLVKRKGQPDVALEWQNVWAEMSPVQVAEV